MSNKKPIYKKTLDQTQGGPSQTMATTRGAPALDRAGNVATQWGAAPENQNLWEGSDPGRKIGVAGGDGTEQVTGMPTWKGMPSIQTEAEKGNTRVTKSKRDTERGASMTPCPGSPGGPAAHGSQGDREVPAKRERAGP